MNVNKPVIPNEVADAIESFRAEHIGNIEITRRLLEDTVTSTRLRAIRSIPFDTFLAALINDYTREMTAEEIAHDYVRREYKQRILDAKAATDRSLVAVNIRETAFADGIKFAVDTLGIKITEVSV